MKILYIGWVGAGNVGDELMLDSFKTLVNKKFGDKYKVFHQMCSEKFDGFEKYDIICLGGGSILADGFIKIMHRGLRAGKKIIIWGSGYDSTLSLDDVEKIEKHKIAYIYPDSIEEKLNDIAREAMYFSVRGPITYSILEGSNIDMTNIIISGDPGFLLEYEEKTVKKIFKKEDNVVAINIGTALNRIYGTNEAFILSELQRVTERLLKKGYKIYLYPVWSHDIKVMLEFYKNLSETENVILDMDIRKGTELLKIIEECKFTINFKLHPNIISAVAGVPFIELCYRVKGYDFARSIECEFLTVNTDCEDIFGEINKIVELIELEGSNISTKILANIKKYKKILSESVDSLGDV